MPIGLNIGYKKFFGADALVLVPNVTVITFLGKMADYLDIILKS